MILKEKLYFYLRLPFSYRERQSSLVLFVLLFVHHYQNQINLRLYPLLDFSLGAPTCRGPHQMKKNLKNNINKNTSCLPIANQLPICPKNADFETPSPKKSTNLKSGGGGFIKRGSQGQKILNSAPITTLVDFVDVSDGVLVVIKRKFSLQISKAVGRFIYTILGTLRFLLILSKF